jgi:asparagine synthetase B (glutamine-hydrolysing)
VNESLAPTPLELAVGSVLGQEPSQPPLAIPRRAEQPRAALERALLPALERPPCVVAFSGGRDSALVLAVAVHVARREGLERPVPVTARFAQAPGTGEREWQELVAGHLGIEDWARVELDQELDLVGPFSAALLRRHGVLHPPHASLFALLAERVPCRSLVTGFGGDQVLGGWIGTRQSGRLPSRRVLRAAAVAAYAFAPRKVRHRALAPEVPPRPWLSDAARREYSARWLESASSEPASWSSYLGWVARRRTLASLVASLDLVLSERGVSALHPLLEHRFLGALAAAGGRTGLGDRAALTRLLAEDDLPPALAGRRTKAHFQHAYFREPSRRFARAWDGSGLDPALVDPEELRRAWLGRFPRGSSGLALQAAWLASAARDREQPLARLGQEIEPAGAH